MTLVPKGGIGRPTGGPPQVTSEFSRVPYLHLFRGEKDPVKPIYCRAIDFGAPELREKRSLFVAGFEVSRLQHAWWIPPGKTHAVLQRRLLYEITS